jgi:hypothetical protein
VKRYAQTILRDAGSLIYTRDKCTSLKNEILQNIIMIGGNDPLEKLIQVLDVQLEKLDTTIAPSVPSSTSTTTSHGQQQMQNSSSGSTTNSTQDISPSPSWQLDST